jgi:iron complex transport system substrate-binding protein
VRALAALAFAGLVASAAAAAPPRVVSLNLCTDELLVAFADPEQILGLGPFAHEGRYALGDAARRFPALSGTAEEVLVLRPDLVVSGALRRQTADLLARRGFRVEEFPFVTSLAEARAQMLRMGALVGHPERAGARVAALDAALDRLRSAGSARRARVLPYARRGWTPGRDTLVSSILEAAGLANAAAELGLTAGGQVSLETVVALRPDALLLGETGEAEDQGRALLEHPALAAAVPPERRIVVPGRLTLCGGPGLVEAIDRFAAELRRLGL